MGRDLAVAEFLELQDAEYHRNLGESVGEKNERGTSARRCGGGVAVQSLAAKSCRRKSAGAGEERTMADRWQSNQRQQHVLWRL